MGSPVRRDDGRRSRESGGNDNLFRRPFAARGADRAAAAVCDVDRRRGRGVVRGVIRRFAENLIAAADSAQRCRPTKDRPGIMELSSELLLGGIIFLPTIVAAALMLFDDKNKEAM